MTGDFRGGAARAETLEEERSALVRCSSCAVANGRIEPGCFPFNRRDYLKTKDPLRRSAREAVSFC
jgi:hypothetical protein